MSPIFVKLRCKIILVIINSCVLHTHHQERKLSYEGESEKLEARVTHVTCRL